MDQAPNLETIKKFGIGEFLKGWLFISVLFVFGGTLMIADWFAARKKR